MSEIGIPNGWKRGFVGDLAKGYRGVSYKPESLCEGVDENTAILLRANNIQDGCLVFEGMQYLPKWLIKKHQNLEFGDIAVCMSNGSKALVGKSAQFKLHTEDLYTVGAFCSVFKPKEAVRVEFLKYLFQDNNYQNHLDIALSGSAINNLKNSDIENISCLIPPAGQQQKISHILTTVDNLIEKTQSLIDKYTAVKQGMMHDLFTRGIDVATGELRPSYEQAPQFYKETELGWVPREWKVLKLKELTQKVIDNRGKTPPFIDQGPHELIETVSISYVDKVPDYKKVTKYVDSNTYQKWFRAHPQKGDILLSTVGEYAGSTAYMSQNRGAIAQNLIAIRAVRECSSVFLFYWTKTNFFSGSVFKVVMNAAQPSIKVPHLLSFFVQTPSLDEQILIAEKLDKITSAIELLRSSASAYLNIKKGLMQDLLTGKVRVDAV